MILWLLGTGLKLIFSRTTPLAVQVVILAIEGTGIGFVFQPGLVALQALCNPQDRAVATSTRNLMRMFGAVVGVAASTAVQYVVMQSSLPKSLPSSLREQVLDGRWQIGQHDHSAWESGILEAKMKGIHAVFIMLAPLIGLCVLGCFFVPSVILKGDETRSGTRTDTEQTGRNEV